jgi:hypothetical protein
MAYRTNMLIIAGVILGGTYVVYKTVQSPLAAINVQAEEQAKIIGTRLIGEKCSESMQCSTALTEKGPGSDPIFGPIACDQGICRLKRKGLLGIQFAPSESTGLPQPEAEKEALKIVQSKGKQIYVKAAYETSGINQDCRSKTDCASSGFSGDQGVGLIGGNVDCCRGKCRWLRKDFIGVPYCPEECVGSLFDKQGSCNRPQNLVPEEVTYNKILQERNRIKTTV